MLDFMAFCAKGLLHICTLMIPHLPSPHKESAARVCASFAAPTLDSATPALVSSGWGMRGCLAGG